MSRIILAGEPQISGSHLYWSATVDPGTFEAPADIVDTIDCFKLTAHDPAGVDVTSELLMQVELKYDGSVLPGDTYQQSVDLSDLHDGYYHLLLSPDGYQGDCETYKLHVSVSGGTLELKTWHRDS